MATPNSSLKKFHDLYIAGTEYKAHVADNAFYVATIPVEVQQYLDLSTPITMVSTRALKHMYDKRTAREYDLIIGCLHTTVQNPDIITTNPEHHGSFGFIKCIENKNYFCSLEVASNYNYVVTCFPIKKIYLANKKIIRNWRGG